jgi:cleavage stimulation factor subunit 1
MLAKSSPDGEMATGKWRQQGHPVIRTLYDHLKDAILPSGLLNCTVKLFDFSKAVAKEL